ncbi:MAG: hypothetical protein AVO35_06095 [Candidatus Aegiribacteria sp. MLS_C]|nr:MAG: hypothetical protein AVO35_06095 [Candidatus Aegiribacteria sp. MLS_C]
MMLMLVPAAAAQPWPEIEWWVDLDAPSFGSAATADLDGDDLSGRCVFRSGTLTAGGPAERLTVETEGMSTGIYVIRLETVSGNCSSLLTVIR